MPLISSFRYRHEIDGLRAWAILAVVFYHAGLGGSPAVMLSKRILLVSGS
jgi:peptidoglycan/LPS O-acetylase OafA/YrhL